MSRERGRVAALQAASVLAVLAAWEGVARAGWVDPLFVPAPSAVARAFPRIGGSALAGLGDTLAKTAIAYVLSVVLGVALGIAVGSVRPLRYGTDLAIIPKLWAWNDGSIPPTGGY